MSTKTMDVVLEARENRNRDYPECKQLYNLPEWERCRTNEKEIAARGNREEIQHCIAQIKQWRPLWNFCYSKIDKYQGEAMDKFIADYRQRAGSQTVPNALANTDLNSCVSIRAKARLTPAGAPSCGVDITNNCSTPVVCQIDISGITANAIPASDRQAIHLMPGEEGERGLSGVMNCGSVEQACKAWKGR